MNKTAFILHCWLIAPTLLISCENKGVNLSGQLTVKNIAEVAISAESPTLTGTSAQIIVGDTLTCNGNEKTASTQLTPTFYFYTSRGQADTAKAIVTGTIGQTSATYRLVTDATEARTDIQTAHAAEVDVASDVIKCQIQYAYPNGKTIVSPFSEPVVIASFESPQATPTATATESPTATSTPTPTASPAIAPTDPTVALSLLSGTTAFKTSTLKCDAQGAQSSNGSTVTYSYSWSKNGSVITGESANTLTGAFVKGDVVSCSAVAAADGLSSNNVTSSSTLTIANSTPTNPTVTSSVQGGGSPTSASTLVCNSSGSTDADGDSLNNLYFWYKNGTIINGQTANTLAGQFQKVDSIVCKAQSSDGTIVSDLVASSAIVILNAPPPAPASVTLAIQGGGATPYSASTLTCSYTNVTDIDGDALSYAYKWYKNNNLIAGQTAATLAGQFTVNDVVKCSVTSNDATDTTEAMSSTLTIQPNEPIVSSFVVKDASTLLPGFTDNTSVTATLTGTDVASYCITTVNTAPAAGDGCWSASTTQSITATANTTTTFYAWGKGSAGNISSTSVSSSIVHSSFTEFAGAGSASSSVSKHITVQWTAASTPDGFDRYHIYVSTTSGGQNFATPTLTVTGVSTTSAVVGELNDATTYYIVVRAATASATENNTAEVSATTPTMPSTASLSAAALYPALATHFDFNLSNIAIGDVVTVAGLYGTGYYKGAHIQSARTISTGGSTSAVFDSAGNFYFNDYYNYAIIKVTAGTQTASVYAGQIGKIGTTGDGGLATAAKLGAITSIAIDANDNLYLADYDFHKVRKITASTGIISTVAGTGSAGYTGDGGPATAAKLYGPAGLAVNSLGEIFISDLENGVIRKVAANGNISTYIAGGSSSGDGGQATSATVHNPRDMVVDSADNLYICDYTGRRIRKVTASTGVITTVAGNGVADSLGNGGQATSAAIYNPIGLAVASDGTFYFSENGGYDVRKVATDGVITKYAGTLWADGYLGDGGAATSARIAPRGLALNSAGDLFITSLDDRSIRRVFASDGTIETYAGSGPVFGSSGDSGQATSAKLAAPNGIVKDSSGNLYIANYSTCTIRKVTPAGVISRFAGRVDSCASAGDGGAATSADLHYPRDLAIDSSGNIYFSEAGNHKIRKILADGSSVTTYAGTGAAGSTGDGGAATSATLNNPAGMMFDSSDNLYIAEASGNRIRKITSAGVISTVAGTGASNYSGNGGAATSATLQLPTSVAVDSSGNLYIADYGNGRIRKVTASTGIISAFITNGSTRISIDSAGNLYGVDPDGGDRIVKIPPSGATSTVIGGANGSAFSGDGGPATSAAFRVLSNIYVDSNGHIYISDTGNHRVRVIRGK